MGKKNNNQNNENILSSRMKKTNHGSTQGKYGQQAEINIFGIFKATNSSDSSTSSANAQEESNDSNKTVKVQKKPKNNKKKFLDTFGTNLTDKAKNGLLDTVIGREQEIERMIQILNRRSKNNPCLIGEPGVGKTAIAQGLALKIAAKDVPAKLLNKEVYLLDMTAIIAGTQFRGQFEARMKSLVDECKTYGNIILVIDEIHNIIGAGDAEHSMNAANILKPSLSNGEIQLIGTTTLKEYRKYIEKDSALERRFQPILVEEPSIQDTIDIIKGIKKYYEDYHKVTITPDIIEKTVKMSEKYIHDRFLPDKAIDILDEACSRINLENKELLKEAGIRVEIPLFANTNVDIPALTGNMASLIRDKEWNVVLDVGGDDDGAIVLSVYKNDIIKNSYDMLFVYNDFDNINIHCRINYDYDIK